MVLPCVVTLYVGGEVFLPGEAFAADFAHMRLLARVDTRVAFEVNTQSKGFVTYVTCMRLLSGVDMHVRVEVTTLMERLKADLTTLPELTSKIYLLNERQKPTT